VCPGAQAKAGHLCSRTNGKRKKTNVQERMAKEKKFNNWSETL
jgi:hypothetical protein